MLIEQGHHVTGLDDYSVGQNKPACSVWRYDIAHDRIPIEKFDWIFHLAGKADIVPSITAPGVYHDANVTGTLRMLEYARHIDCKRFIYAASSSCYGIPDLVPTSESAAIRPQYPYALTKYLGEQYVMHYAKVYDLPAISLRLFNVFGPHFRTAGTYGAVFGVFLAQLANDKPLTVVGDGTQIRDFTYVTDVCRAFIAAAESPISGEIYNVGSGNPKPIRYLTELLAPKEIIYIPKRPGEPSVTFADNFKIKDHLDWEAQISFEDGVGEMLKHIESYKNAPLWDPQKIAAATKQWFTQLEGKGVI